MSFGENLQYLRRERGLTQEELAEYMSVSRQTVSKWEAGGAYPEMEKLMSLCQLFAVSMDTLLRGNAEESRRCDTQDYDTHMNRFTYQIMTGVGLVLLGVTLLLLLCGVGLPDTWATLVFFAFLIVAVSIFIVSGINHGNYVQDNPSVSFTYDEETVRAFRRKLPVLIVVPIALILLGVMALMAVYNLAGEAQSDMLDYFACSGLLLCVTIATPILVYAGMQSSKYDVTSYNRENSPSDHSPAARRHRRAERLSSCIMLTATAAFLLMGFLGNLWHPGWVVFPIGGIACAIAENIVGKEDD